MKKGRLWQSREAAGKTRWDVFVERSSGKPSWIAIGRPVAAKGACRERLLAMVIEPMLQEVARMAEPRLRERQVALFAAIPLAVANGFITTQIVQVGLGVGYTEAAWICDRIQELGIANFLPRTPPPQDRALPFVSGEPPF